MDSSRSWNYTSAHRQQGLWHECPGAHDSNFQLVPASEMTPSPDVDWDIDSMLAQCMWDASNATAASSTPPDDHMSPFLTPVDYPNTESAHFSSWSIRTPSRSTPETLDDISTITSRKERRRAQNRKAQSAFRQRKDRLIGILEEEVRRLKGINQNLTSTNDAFIAQVADLRAKINAVQSASLSIPSPTSDLPYEVTTPELERKREFVLPCGPSPTNCRKSPQTSRRISPPSGMSSKKKPRHRTQSVADHES